MTIERMMGFIPKDSVTPGDEPTYKAEFYGTRAAFVEIPKMLLDSLGITFEEGDEAIIRADVEVTAEKLRYGETVNNVDFKGYMPNLQGKTLDDLYGGSEWRQRHET